MLTSFSKKFLITFAIIGLVFINYQIWTGSVPLNSIWERMLYSGIFTFFIIFAVLFIMWLIKKLNS
jgi:type IV secretory pathway VirB6-like protein